MVARLNSPVLPAVLALAVVAAATGTAAGASPKYAIAGVLGLVFLLVTLADVTIGFCMLAALSILDAQGTLGVAKLAGGAVAVSWLLTVATHRLRRATFAEALAPLAFAMLVFVAWVAVSIVWAENRSATIVAVERYVPNMLLIPICFDAIRERRHVVWLLATIVVSATLAAVLGILIPPPDPNSFEAGRASGTFGDANEFAAAMVAGLPLAAAFAMRRAGTPVARTLAAVAVCLTLLAVILTLSRGGLVALGAAIPAAVIFAGRWRARALAVGAGLVATGIAYFAFFVSLPARQRVTDVGGGTGRLDVWTVGERMVSAHPLRGVGAGNFTNASVHYLLRPGLIKRADFIVSRPKVAHNTYLQIAAELGIPAVLLWMAIVLFCLGCAVAAARAFARSEDVALEILARGVIVAVIGYLAAIMFISEMYSKLLWLLLALGPAVLAVARQERRYGLTNLDRAVGAGKRGLQ